MLLVRLKSSLGVLVVKWNIVDIVEVPISTLDAYQFSDETIFDLSPYNEFSFDQITLKDNDKITMYKIACEDIHSNKAISFLFKKEAMGEYQKLKRILEDRLAK